MMKRIYFLSDIHLGAHTIAHPRLHEARVVRWLDSIKQEASTLYLMGDILDFWFEYKQVVPRGFTRFFGKIAELADSGIEVHWFIGNHDIWIFDYLPHELGVTMHYGAEEVVLAGKRFYLAHGDGVGDKSTKFKVMHGVFHNRLCQRLFAAVHPRWTVGFALNCSKSSRESHLEGEPYLGEHNEPLICFAKEYAATHPIDYFIFGHRHLMLDLMLSRSSRILILGDWIEHFSYAVFDGEHIWLEQYEEEC